MFSHFFFKTSRTVPRLRGHGFTQLYICTVFVRQVGISSRTNSSIKARMRKRSRDSSYGSQPFFGPTRCMHDSKASYYAYTYQTAATIQHLNGGENAPGLEARQLNVVRRSADCSDDLLVIRRSPTLPSRCLDKASRRSGHVGGHAQCDSDIDKSTREFDVGKCPIDLAAAMPGLCSPSEIAGQISKGGRPRLLRHCAGKAERSHSQRRVA